MSIPFPEYEQYDALGLAGLIKNNEISPIELLEAAQYRIETINPKINAVHMPYFDQAREQILSLPTPQEKTQYKAPFLGVPFLIKDILHHVKGWPLTQGVGCTKHILSTEDSFFVEKCRQAGLVFLGRTNIPEFGLKGHCDNKFFGPTRNPWNLERTPGGSSGGSAAAVASGMVPMASANDGGGSIRIPASFCGLFGLKPSRGRTSCGPHYSEGWDGMVSDHVLTRTVRDSAAMLDVLSGPMPGDPYLLPQPQHNYLDIIQQRPRQLSIAFNLESPIGTPVDKEAKNAVEKAVTILTDLGHRVEEAKPDINGDTLAECYLMVYFAHVGAEYQQLVSQVGKKVACANTDVDTQVLALLGNSVSAQEYVSHRFKWNEFSRSMGKFHQHYDLYLTPTIAQKAPLIGSQEMSKLEEAASRLVLKLKLGNVLLATGLVQKESRENLAKVPFTQQANFTGQPAMSVPLYFSEKDQLPYGVQFMAPVGDEATLLQLASQLENASPWIR